MQFLSGRVGLSLAERGFLERQQGSAQGVGMQQEAGSSVCGFPLTLRVNARPL